MTRNEVRKVIERAMRDEQFLNEFQSDPDAALEGFDLSRAEVAGLKSGDDERIRSAIGDPEEKKARHDYPMGPAPGAGSFHPTGSTPRHGSDD